jgi:hypothetical protein
MLAGALLCACDDPAWRDPATAKGTAQLTPAVQAAVLAGLADLKPNARAKITLIQPLPALPDWSRPLLGQPLRGPFPNKGGKRCLGNVDAVRVRYLGEPGGVMIVGWAWDTLDKAPPARVILVDDSLLIRGAGVTGSARPGVPKALPEVTTDKVGWEALVPRQVGPLDAFGVMADGKTVCRLGHIDL